MGRNGLRAAFLASAWGPWIASIALQLVQSVVLYGPPASPWVRIMGWVVGLAVLDLNAMAIVSLRTRCRR